MVALAALNVLLGIVLVALAPPVERRPALWKAVALTTGFLIAAATGGDSYLRAMTNRIHRDSGPSARVLAYGEGRAATCIAAGIRRQRDSLSLYVDGQGMTKLVSETKLLTHLPYLLAKDPKRYLIICFGMGTTTRSASRYPHLEIDAVDLVPEVFDYFPHYHADADRVREHAGLRFLVNDGRNHLLVTDKQYDLITVDPAPPIHSAGTVNLYTREFFALAQSRLTDGGVFCLWLPPGPESEVVRILRTFTNVFPNGSIWGALEYPGFYLIGGRQPIRPTPTERADIARKLSQIDELAEWSDTYHDEKLLESLFVMDAEALAHLLRDVPIVTDDRPYTEFPVWRLMFSPQGRRVMSANSIRDRASPFWQDRSQTPALDRVAESDPTR
jgi:spermidine synthase